MLLQDCPVDVANYYTGEIQGFGLFTFHGSPRKNYYAFKAFRQLLDCAVRVATPPTEAGKVTWCAGRNEKGTAAAILISNFNTPDTNLTITPTGLPWTGASQVEVLKVDGERDLQPIRSGLVERGQAIELDKFEAPAVVLIKLAPEKPTAP